MFGKKEIFAVLITFLVLTVIFFFNDESYAISKNVPIITSFEKSTQESNALKVIINSNNTGADYSLELVNETTGEQTNLAGSTKSYTYQNLESGKEYKIMLRACTNSANDYSCTAWSKEMKASAGEISDEKQTNTNKTTTNTNTTNTNTTNTTPATKKVTTQPVKTSLAKSTISNVSAKYIYYTKAVSPVPKVTISGKTLKSGTDYTVSYKNNKAPGTATVTVTGKGNYTSSKSKNYTIYIGDTTKTKKKKGKVTLSGKTFRIYGQNYSGTWNGGESIRGSGCGPAATAAIISGYGYNLNTKQVAKASTKYNKKYKNRGARGKGQMYYMQSLGFNTKIHYNKKESNAVAEANIKKALQQGHQLWFQVGRGSQKKYWKKFTYGKGWHNIAVLSIDKSGKYVYVAGGKKQWCKLSDLAKARLKDNGSRFYLEVWKPLP